MTQLKGVKMVLDIAEGNMKNIKIKIILWLIRKWDFLIVGRCNEMGCVLTNTDEESERHLRAILHASFRDGREDVKSLILGASEDWLKEREVETKNFIERIK